MARAHPPVICAAPGAFDLGSLDLVRAFNWREHVAPSLILPQRGGVAQSGVGRRG